MLGRLRRRLSSTFSAGGWLPVIHRAAPGCIALTFDDGPTPETTPRVLALLRQHDARASFFLSGTRIAAFPELVAAICAEGHDALPHGFRHLRLNEMPPEAAIAELAETEALLARHRPAPSPYPVRLPYGAGHRDTRMHALLRRWRPDCQVAHWRYDFKDFRLAEGCRTEAELAQRCQDAVARAFSTPSFPGSVVLMHESPFGAEGALTPEIAPTLLAALLAEAGRRGVAATGVPPLARHPLFERWVRTVSME